jgi:uncharacterized protein
MYMRYTVFVKFNSTGKIQDNGQEITVCVKSKPERGKANKELVERLATYFALSKDRVRIISGLKSTKKLVEIEKENQTF